MIRRVKRYSETTFKTYKHIWKLMPSGDWIIKNRNFYPLGFLKFLGGSLKTFGHVKILTSKPESIYEKNDFNGQKFMNIHDREVQQYRVQKFFVDDQLLDLIQNKRILDISGGSGYFAAELVKYGAQSVMTTELSEEVVNFIKMNVGIQSVKYDLNKDVLESLVDGQTFDLIMLRGCIEFSNNLPALIAQLDLILNDSGKILITFIEPTLGSVLRTQFDDYNVKLIRPAINIEQYFSSKQFDLYLKKELFLFNRDFAFEHLANRLKYLYIFYLLKFLILHGNKSLFNSFSLESKCELRVFQRQVKL